MRMSLGVVECVVEELSGLVERGVVRKVWCGGALWFVLEVRVPGKNQYILYSLEREGERVHAVPDHPSQPPSPPSFVMLLRKHLVGGRVHAVRVVGGDRIVALEVTRGDGEESGRFVRKTLMLELFGVHSNLLLLDGEGCVIASMRHPSTLSEDRVARSGAVYVPPESGDRLLERGADPLGVCGLLADGSRSQAIHEHIEPFLRHREALEVSRSLLKRLRGHLKKMRRTTRAVGRDLERAEEASSYKVYGELLQGAYGRVERGASSVVVTDYYDPDLREVSIALDPKKDLKTNIQRYFRLYRRYSNAIPSIEERQLGLWERTEALERALQTAEGLAFVATRGHVGSPSGTPSECSPDEALGQLRALQVLWESEKLLLPQRARVQRASDPKPEPLPYRTFTSKTGATILVGKSSKHNDALSIRVARGNDLWLHAHNHAGSHVIIRLNRNQDPDHETLLDAATLAAHYSKARNDTHIDVQYTRAKHVRKPKGAPAGLVSVAAAKTLTLRLEPQRVRRLFDSVE